MRPPASASATMPTTPSFARLPCAFFFTTREPTFQTTHPSAAFLRVPLIVLFFPGRSGPNPLVRLAAQRYCGAACEDKPDEADRNHLAPLLTCLALDDPPRE